MSDNPYFDISEEFNAGRLRCILSSGQAVVMHRLAIMSKDGDWIVREDDEALGHILTVLEAREAKYRLGAPLDARWLRGGWSAHLEFRANGYRVRTDFVSRPPRLSEDDLAALWQEQENGASGHFPVATLDLPRLIALKKTQRERDYSVIGDLARQLPVEQQLLHSRSARDLIALFEQYPEAVAYLQEQRPLLAQLGQGREKLQMLLAQEQFDLMRQDEMRLENYARASAQWTANWPRLQKQIADLPLSQAHPIVVQTAQEILPKSP